MRAFISVAWLLNFLVIAINIFSYCVDVFETNFIMSIVVNIAIAIGGTFYVVECREEDRQRRKEEVEKEWYR